MVIIDEDLARHASAGEDPAGKVFWILSFGERPVQGDRRPRPCSPLAGGDDLSAVQDQCCYPLAQVPDPLVRFFSSVLSVVVRTQVAPFATVDAIEKQVRGTTGEQTLYEVRTM